jgi:hypothetical protein
MNNFLYCSFFQFEMQFRLKIQETRLVLRFRKLIKIARCLLKIQEFAWSYEIKFGTLFMLAISSKSPRVLD